MEAKKTPKNKLSRKEWMTPGLVRSCNLKSRLYKKYKKYPTVIMKLFISDIVTN